MSRREDRERTFSLLYEYTFHDGKDPEIFLTDKEQFNDEAISDHVRECFLGAVKAQGEIDKYISDNSRGWKLKRLSKVTLSLLRTAVYELVFTDVPPKAVINEAVELSKIYDEKKSSGFINGILNSIARSEGKLGDAAPAVSAGDTSAVGSENEASDDADAPKTPDTPQDE